MGRDNWFLTEKVGVRGIVVTIERGQCLSCQQFLRVDLVVVYLP